MHSDRLWKSVENAMSALAVSTQIAMRACSACAGDYEDPDRTTRCPEGGWNEEDFPADEETLPE